jgi:uncharacterized protein
MKHSCTISLILITFLFGSCSKPKPQHKLSSSDSTRILNEIFTYRTEQDSFFRFSAESPFRRDTTQHFDSLKYFPPDLSFYFQSKIYKYSTPETVIVLGTKGEERKQLKYGYFILDYNGKEYRINAYKFTPYDKHYKMYKDNLSFWFRDKTTDKETYHVGRYVEIGNENTNPDFLYTLDLNRAFNPYCAYSSLYSCAIPRDEDYLDFEVRAGEKKYH